MENKPYHIIQRKIVLKYSFLKLLSINIADEIISKIISYIYGSLIIKCNRESLSRSLRIYKLDSFTYEQIKEEIHGLLGFNLLNKQNGTYKLCDIHSIGSYINDFDIKIISQGRNFESKISAANRNIESKLSAKGSQILNQNCRLNPQDLNRTYQCIDLQGRFRKSTAKKAKSRAIKNDCRTVSHGEIISYKDFCLCPPESCNDLFYIYKMNGCMYDVLIGCDILFLIMNILYNIKCVKISKKKRKKLKLKGSEYIII